MCTALVSFDPSAAFPVLLVGVRDEFVARSWSPPDRHWPDHPGLIGGRDLRAGGTWLAADPAAPRVACVLNGRGRLAPDAVRVSRGVLPLRAAAGGALDDLDVERFDPFHLLCAEPGRVRLWSWDGRALDERALAPGLHMVVNSGLEGEPPGGHRDRAEAGDEPEPPDEGAMRAHMSARIAHFRPRFAAAARPDPSGAGREAWGEWSALVEGDGLDRADHRALIVEHDLGGGRVWGTTSVSLVALGPARLRYDFTAEPGVPGAWRTVHGAGEPAGPRG